MIILMRVDVHVQFGSDCCTHVVNRLNCGQSSFLDFFKFIYTLDDYHKEKCIEAAEQNLIRYTM